MKLGKCYVRDVIGMDSYLENREKKAGTVDVSFFPLEGGRHGFSKRHDRAAIERLKQFLGMGRL